MDGMTGFNPEESLRKIKETVDALERALGSGYQRACEDFFYKLQKKWYSPRAIEFGKKFIPLLKEVIKDSRKLVQSLYINSMEAYNKLATANGYPRAELNQIVDPDFLYEVTLEDFGQHPGFEDNYYGTVGMNVLHVKEILNKFIADVAFAKKDLTEVPVGVAFYDPEGAMASAYKTEVEKLAGKISESLEGISKEINSAMQEEENTVLIAKDNATDTMSA